MINKSKFSTEEFVNSNTHPITHLGVSEIDILVETSAESPVSNLDLRFGSDENIRGLQERTR